MRHGDLLSPDLGRGDQVLLIDGLFLQAASVRHREILCLLERGVTVAGSSSMGALRAAELWPYGMRGYGEIFRLYRDGEIDGDDEVAIVHGTREDGYRGYSEPLVNIRIALRDAAADGVLAAGQARLMAELATAMPFRSRSFRALEDAALAQSRPAQSGPSGPGAWRTTPMPRRATRGSCSPRPRPGTRRCGRPEQATSPSATCIPGCWMPGSTGSTAARRTASGSPTPRRSPLSSSLIPLSPMPTAGTSWPGSPAWILATRRSSAAPRASHGRGDSRFRSRARTWQTAGSPQRT